MRSALSCSARFSRSHWILRSEAALRSLCTAPAEPDSPRSLLPLGPPPAFAALLFEQELLSDSLFSGPGRLRLAAQRSLAPQPAQERLGFPSAFPPDTLLELAVPKRKVTPSRKGIRSTGKHLRFAPVVAKCASCGKVKRIHGQCPFCFGGPSGAEPTGS